jgi:hypothetical protein
MTPYLVSKFEEATLAALIHESFGYDHKDIFDKPQISYIYRYLNGFKSDPDDEYSILLEPRYIDRDFMEDYSNFYVGRFGNDGYKCARLHFFSCQLKHKSLDSLLHGSPNDGMSVEWLQKNYLGFMVIKPLTKTFVGKTCLRIAGDTAFGAGTKKKISKRYEVNLFGVNLHVDSVAFQEQDKVVAACATTAIWTALHSLPGRSVKEITSCSEITTAALNFSDGSNNGFPNKELSNKQILRTLDVEGLRYHNSNLLTRSREWFRRYIIAHIDSDLPVIMTGNVYRLVELDASGNTASAKRQLKLLGRHAITTLGYDFRGDSRWVYLHDDRLGPYTRAKLTTVGALIGLGTADVMRSYCALVMTVRSGDEEWEEVIVPDMAIVPVDKKARLQYTFASVTADRIAREIIPWMQQTGISEQALKCHIQLTSIAQVREDVLRHNAPYEPGQVVLEGLHQVEALQMERWREDKVRFLTQHLARLQWQMDFYWGDLRVFRVLLDATDIPLGNAISGIYIFDPVYAELVLGAFGEQGVDPGTASVDKGEQHFYNAFLKALKRRRDDYEHHLNRCYGALRAPNYIKEHEVSKNGEGTNLTKRHFYDPVEESLASMYPDVAQKNERRLIWAIGKDGSLFVAEDIMSPIILGHPSMTGMQPARIAGEIRYDMSGETPLWRVNAESGRYSRDYEKASHYLTCAVRKIKSFFPDNITEALPAVDSPEVGMEEPEIPVSG